MKYIFLFIVLLITNGFVYGQQSKDTLLAFFTTGFNDNVRIYLDNKKIDEVKILSDSKTGWSNFGMIIPLTDSSQKLTIFNVMYNRKSETVLTKKYKILYVSKGYDHKYDFVFSNSLDLPCESN